MGTIIGFVIGYLVGLQDGRNGSATELREAWQTLRSSSTVRTLLANMPSLLGQAIKQRVGLYTSQANRS